MSAERVRPTPKDTKIERRKFIPETARKRKKESRRREARRKKEDALREAIRLRPLSRILGRNYEEWGFEKFGVITWGRRRWKTLVYIGEIKFNVDLALSLIVLEQPRVSEKGILSYNWYYGIEYGDPLKEDIRRGRSDWHRERRIRRAAANCESTAEGILDVKMQRDVKKFRGY